MHLHLPHLLTPILVAVAVLSVGQGLHFSPSDYLVLVGATAFAIASARNGRMKLLRDTNEDLALRNDQLESEKLVMKTQIDQLEKLPTVTSLERLLEKLIDRIEHHDIAMKALAVGQSHAFDEVVAVLRDIHTAVIPPR